MKNPENVVEFDNVHTYFFTDIGTVKAVDGVSFEIPQRKNSWCCWRVRLWKVCNKPFPYAAGTASQGQTVEGEIRFKPETRFTTLQTLRQ